MLECLPGKVMIYWARGGKWEQVLLLQARRYGSDSSDVPQVFSHRTEKYDTKPDVRLH